MKKRYSIILLACYFLIFLIPESNQFYISWDRSDVQVLILSLLNFTTFGFLLANNILVKNLSRSINERIILSYTIYIGISLISIIFLPTLMLPTNIVLFGGKMMGRWAAVCLRLHRTLHERLLRLARAPQPCFFKHLC